MYQPNRIFTIVLLLVSVSVPTVAAAPTRGVVDTAQAHCYDASQAIDCPSGRFSGQDAQYQGLAPAYHDHGDGTVTDLNTGLMWQQDPGAKQDYQDAVAGAASFGLAGYDDWRVPSIKELYSLIDFRGVDPISDDLSRVRPFIDADVFRFSYGDPSAGERVIDSQWVTSTIYESTVMRGVPCFFGVNFADGRIKCYPTGRGKGFYAIYVRGSRYGDNDFTAHGDGTITDRATQLVWQQADNGAAVNWADALNYCEDLVLAGEDDWRLPNAKELQSIVDYTRSPDSTGSAAIDPLFSTSRITNEAGQDDYPYYWTSTTHVNERGGAHAVYLAFGRALGYMRGRWLDVHGAGAQRSDPKTGSPEDFPRGRGPQGDARRAENYVRCVRGGAEPSAGEPARTAPKTVAAPGMPRRGGGGPPGQFPTGGSSARHFPPQEAITACHGKNDGATCSFIAPHGTVIGRCRTMRGQKECVPARPPRGRPQR